MDCFKTQGVAFLTGAGHGIGRATAIAFAQSGASAIAVSDIDGPAAEAVALELPKWATHASFAAVGIALDATKRDAADAAVARVVAQFGRIDYFVHSVGRGSPKHAETKDYDLDAFDRVIEVNTKSVIVCGGAVAEQMLRQEPRKFKAPTGEERDAGRGSIVVVLSALALVAQPLKLAYTASKHASLAVVKTMALELGSKGIRVNYMAPIWVRTAMYEGDKRATPGLDDIIKAVVPAGRPMEPDEVASGIIYLSSPAASYVHGYGLLLDSGLGLSVIRQV